MKKRIFTLAVALATGVATLNAQSKIYDFPFDNSYNATVGTGSFTSNDSTSFVTDRHGNANGAIHIVNAGSNATLVDLPYGKASRSIALWVKINVQDPMDYNMLFKYGTPSAGNAFSGCAGLVLVQFMTYDNNFYISNPTATGEWNHFVFSFNEADSVGAIYKNGVQIKTQTMTDLNTINDNDLFHLGTGPGNETWFNGVIDDLQIYDYALSPTQVAGLFSSTTAGINEINTSNIIAMYPNPANSVLNIEVKDISAPLNIQIVNVLGKTIATQQLNTGNNKVDVSDLTNGVYFISIANGGAVKFIKE